MRSKKAKRVLPLQAKGHIVQMKVSVRVHSLSLGGGGNKSLPAMESHGKRLDQTSQARKVRDVAPLVHGSLDLRDAFDAHVEGCRMNKGLKRPVLHAVVQYPKELKPTEANQRKMLNNAVEFINQSHGGDAVFAARLDRDEDGQNTVDVFYSPKYQKHTKARGEETWISTSKHGKELCHQYRDTIIRRSKNGEFNTRPRDVGIALQEDLYHFMAKRKLKLQARTEKDHGMPDRVEPEVYKQRQELARQQRQVEQDAAEVLKLQMQLKSTQKEMADEVRAIEKAVPAASLGERVREKITGAIGRMKNAFSKFGMDLDEVADKADQIMDRNHDPESDSGLTM